MKRFLESSFSTAIFTAGAAACTMVFPCVEIYLRNRDFFALPPGGAFGFAVLGFFICFAIGSAVLILLRNTRIFPLVNAVFLGAGVSLLLQYLSWSNYFPEQASDDFYGWEILFLISFHLLLLLLPVIAAVCFRRAVCRNAEKIAAVIILTQIVSVIAAFRNHPAQDYDFTDYTISEKTKFEFAREENVIILVVDAMGERICKKVLTEYPELQTALKDFICFDRMVSPIPRTMYAVPALLTGMEYPVQKSEEDNDEGHAEYLNRACRSENSVFQGLKRNGFRTEGYPFILQTISYSPEVIDNSMRITYQAEKQSAIKILDAALSRQIPFFIKPLLEDYYYFATNRFVTPQDETDDRAAANEPFDITFYRRLNGEFRVGNRNRVFKYLHIHGAHDPVRTDENLELSQETSKHRQLRGSLKIVELLLAKLKAAGLYDNATIVVVGDHTEFYTPENLAFIKLKQQKNDVLLYNSVPCRISDIAGTVLKETYPSEGLRSLYDLPPVLSSGSSRESDRTRSLQFGNWKETGNDSMSEYTLYSKSYSLENGRLLIEPEWEDADNPGRVSLLMRSIKSGDCWSSKAASDGKDFQFWESPALDFPDGIYQIFIQKYNAGGKEYRQSLPQFLVIANGKYQWKKEYPDIPPRAMAIGEEILFRPMRPYPQIEFCGGTVFLESSVVLGKDQALKIRLPALKTPARLEFSLRYSPVTPGKLILLENEAELAEISVKEPKTLKISTVLPPGNARTVKLQFRFLPRRGNREEMRNYRIFLLGAGLHSL